MEKFEGERKEISRQTIREELVNTTGQALPTIPELGLARPPLRTTRKGTSCCQKKKLYTLHGEKGEDSVIKISKRLGCV